MRSIYDFVPAPVGHWRMNDNAASAVVVDSTGAKNGTYKDGGVNVNTSTGSVAGKKNLALDLDTNEHIDIGNHGSSIKSIAVWCKPDAVDVTDYLIDLNGIDYITIVNGTVTQNGFGTGTQIIYVDGVVAATVTADWHLIILTSTDGFTASDLDIGRLGGVGYFNGLVDNVMFFDTVLTVRQAMKLAGFRGKEPIYRSRPNKLFHANINNKNGIFGGVKEGCMI